MKILLADHKSEILSALRLLIEQEDGLTVVAEVVEVTELVVNTQTAQPDVILLDWELQGLEKLASHKESGNSAISVLRVHCPSLKVIVLSSNPEARDQALAAGADAFVSKGNPPDKLLELLKKSGNCTKEQSCLERGEI